MKKVLFFAAVLTTTLLASCDKEDKEWLQDTISDNLNNITSGDGEKTAPENTKEAKTTRFQAESDNTAINN